MADTVDNLQAIVELRKKINELTAESKTLTEEEKQLLENLQLALDSRIEKEKNSIELQQKRIDNIQVELDKLTAIYNLTEKKTIADKENFEIETRSKELQKQKLEFEKEFASLNDEERKKKLEDIQKEEYDLKILKQKKDATDDLGQTLANKLGISVKEGSVFDLLTDDDGTVNINKFSEDLASFGSKFMEKFINPQKIGASILEKVYAATYEGVIALDAQRASLTKATGAINGYVSELNRTANVVAMNGVSAELAGSSMISLAKNFSNFKDVSTQTRIELASTVANLTALGVSSDTAAKNLSTLIQSFGMSEQQAIATSKELAVLANVLGTSPERIASDFAAAASTMVVYGDKGIQVFKGLEAAAKASGLEVSTLLGIVKKMDTFQGAAEAAGKLNAVLGGGLLNSSQLLVATEEERIRMVVESVQLQGIQFGDLDKYTQMTIANAAGISDMAQANKLFGMSLSEYDKYAAQTEKSKEASGRFSDMVMSASTSLDKLKVAGQQMAIGLTPLVYLFSAIVDGFVMGITVINGLYEAIMFGLSSVYEFLNSFAVMKAFFGFIKDIGTPVLNFLGETFKFLISVVSTVIGLMVALRVAHIAYTAVQYISTLAINRDTIAKTFNTIATSILGAQLAKTTIGTYALAMAKYAATLASFLMAIAVKVLTVALALLGSPITLIVLGIIALVAIVYAAIKNFDTWGKVVLFLLGPIGWLVLGIKKLYDMFHLAGSPMFYEIAYYIAEGFKLFGNALEVVAPAILTIANAVQTLALSMIKLFYSIAGLAAALPMFAYGLAASIPAMIAFAGASTAMFFGGNYLDKILSAVTPERSMGLKVVVGSLEELNKIHKEIKPEGLNNIKQLVDQVERYNLELMANSAASISAPIASLIKALSSGSEAETPTAQKEVIMKLNDKVLGNFVIETINSYGGGNVAVKKATAAGTKG